MCSSDLQKILKDPELKAQVTHMIAQENWHSYSHKKYNEWLESLGLPATELSLRFLDSLTRRKKRADKIFGESFWVPGVVAGEHTAACFIEYFLERPHLFEQMHPHFKQAWMWHFIEEIEHKGTSMDMWIDTKDVYDRKKWKLNLAHIVQSTTFNLAVLRYTIILLNRDNQLWKWRTFKDGMSFLFSRNGLFFNTVLPWFTLFKSDFHPWNHDTRYLIEKYEKIINTEELSPERQQQVEKEFEGCVADIESVIEQNNKIHVI